jgi:hypothetical protein
MEHKTQTSLKYPEKKAFEGRWLGDHLSVLVS